jgi:hypothetical protein
MEEVGKHLRNNTDVVGLLHILEVENRSSVHIYVEHRIDKVVFVDQHLLLPPPGPHLDGPNDDVIIRDGHGIPEVDVSFGDGDCIPNAEGNVGDKDDIHVEGRSQDNIRVAIGAKGTRDKAVREREKKKKKKYNKKKKKKNVAISTKNDVHCRKKRIVATKQGGARSGSKTGKATQGVCKRGGRSDKSATQRDSIGVDLVDEEEL